MSCQKVLENSSYKLALETTLYLASGALGARLVTDQSWIVKGCLLGGINQVGCWIGSRSLSTDHPQLAKIAFLICTALATKAFANAASKPLETKLLASATIFNGVSQLLFSHFSRF